LIVPGTPPSDITRWGHPGSNSMYFYEGLSVLCYDTTPLPVPSDM
jgi:hypothetical protein